MIHKKFNLRCLTAGVSIERKTHRQVLEDAEVFLIKGKKILMEAGYDLQMMRLSTNPFEEYIAGLNSADAVHFIKELADFTKIRDIFLSIGPLSFARDPEDKLVDVLCAALTETSVFAGIHISKMGKGIQRDGICAAARAIKRMEEISMMANFQFAALANVPPDTPFFPAAFHVGPQNIFTLGAEAAELALQAFRSARDLESAENRMKEIFEDEFQAIEKTCLIIQKETGWTYGGLDTSPAPMKDVSIGAAIESLTHVPFGRAGTLTACALITRVIQDVGVRRAGYCGLMLPVMEDEVLAARAAEGYYGLSDLLAFSAVCGTGLDVIPLPGDVTQGELERLLADVASLAVKLHKPLSARLIPVPGKGAGEAVCLDSPYLVGTKVFSI